MPSRYVQGGGSSLCRNYVMINEEKILKANLGGIDRTIRILLGLGLIAAALFGVIGAWGWLGLIPLATGVVRFCPVYGLFGLRTCAVKTGSGISRRIPTSRK